MTWVRLRGAMVTPDCRDDQSWWHLLVIDPNNDVAGQIPIEYAIKLRDQLDYRIALAERERG